MITRIDQLLSARWFYWFRILQFIVALVIFTTVALLPSDQLNKLPTSDKYLHFLGNFLLFSSAWIACFGRLKLRLLIILLIPYSIMIEIAQWLAPSRQVDSKDMIANIAGLICGYVVATTVEWCWDKLKQKNDEAQGNSGGNI